MIQWWQILPRCAGSKISPDFSAQNIKTAGTLQTGSAVVSGTLSVTGNLKCQDLLVTAGPIPDYVFDATYKLIDLNDLDIQIKKLHHLPGVNSAAEISKNGLSVPGMVTKELEKIEELTLYVIKLNKKQEDLSALCQDLLAQNRTLKEQLQSVNRH